MTFARRPEGDPERAYRAMAADLSTVPEPRLRRRRIRTLVVLVVSGVALIGGVVGLASNPGTLGMSLLVIALTTAGAIFAAQSIVGLVRVQHELSLRRAAAAAVESRDP